MVVDPILQDLVLYGASKMATVVVGLAAAIVASRGPAQPPAVSKTVAIPELSVTATITPGGRLMDRVPCTESVRFSLLL